MPLVPRTLPPPRNEDRPMALSLDLLRPDDLLALHFELHNLRVAADRQILRGVRRPYSEFIAWRADELIAASSRRRRVRPLQQLVRDLERKTLPGASPVNRVAARRHLVELRELAERLADETRPCDARALLLLDWFLTGPGSPLYAREREAAFSRSLAEIRHELQAAEQ